MWHSLFGGFPKFEKETSRVDPSKANFTEIKKANVKNEQVEVALVEDTLPIKVVDVHAGVQVQGNGRGTGGVKRTGW